MKPCRVDFISNQPSHYRATLWNLIVNNSAIDALFVFGCNSVNDIRPINFSDQRWRNLASRLTILRNVYIARTLVWQHNVLRHVRFTEARAIVMLGDMYVISTWIAACIARFRGIPLLFWGHGLYGSEGRLKRWIRTSFLSLADCNLVYGEHARKMLLASGFSPDRVRVVYNSIDHASQLAIRESAVKPGFFSSKGWFENSTVPTLVFVGRLTPQKRLDLLVKAIRDLRDHGHLFNLLIIGSGSETERLHELSVDLAGQVHFYGACYDEEELAYLISNSDLCVSPGEVGLTAMHALGYGTPVCTHGDLTKQMPEAEAIIEGKTGVLFNLRKMDIDTAVLRWFDSAPERQIVRENCYIEVDTKWNADNQARLIVNAALSMAR